MFVVTKTSNAGSADVQDLRSPDGEIVWHHVAQACARVGRGARRRARAVERRARDRRDLSTCGRRGAQDVPATGAAPAGHRCAGRGPGRGRARVHERTGERNRRRGARDRLRVPRARGRLANGCGCRGLASARRDLGRLRLVDETAARCSARRARACRACARRAPASGAGARLRRRRRQDRRGARRA